MIFFIGGYVILNLKVQVENYIRKTLILRVSSHIYVFVSVYFDACRTQR